MAGDRELPPLRVKLYGDNSQYKQMLKDSEDAVNAFKEHANKSAAKVKVGAPDKEFLRVFHNYRLLEKSKDTLEKQAARNAKNEEDRIFRNAALLEKSQAIQAKVGAQKLKDAQSLARIQEQERQRAEKHHQWMVAAQQRLQQSAQRHQQSMQQSAQRHQQMMANSQQRLQQSAQRHQQSMQAGSQRMQQSAQRHQQSMQQSAQRHQQSIAATQQRMQQSATKHQQSLQQSAQKHQQTLQQSAQRHQQSSQQSAQKHQQQLYQRAQKHQQSLQQSATRHQQQLATAQARAAQQAAFTQQRMQQSAAMHAARMARMNQQQQGKGRGGSSYGQFGGLGDRADIYMHANAIRTLIDMSSSFVAASADWQRMQVQLETLTGSAAEATQVMDRLRKEALESPYNMQGLMDAAKTMMAYGASSKQAQDVTKMLGDVAGGSNDKLSRLSLGMAQIISLGKLQGNELRQLTEHGFNPLRTIAERTLKPMQSMEDRMRELNEAKEKGRITSDMVVKAIEIETSAGGRFAGMAYRMSQDVWGLTQQIQELVTLIKKRFMDTLLKDTQNALRVVIDFLKKVDAWAQANEELVATIARVVRNVMVAAVVFNMLGMAIAMTKWQLRMASMIFAFFGTVVNTVTGAVRALRIGLIALAINNPVGWIVIAIGAALALGAAIMHPGGPVGAFKAFMAWGQTAVQNVIGFFYNFQENVAIIGAWLSANWGKLFIGMVSMSVRIFTVFMTWLIAYLPMKAWEAGTYFMGKLIDAVSFGLQKLGEMFSFFWANITNPAAILEYLSKFTSTLAGDISTTMSDGLVGGITKVMSEELAALNLPELNLKGPEYKGPEEPVPPDLPTAPDVDFNSMMGPGGGGRAASPVTAVRAGSGEAATMAHQYMMGRAGKRAGGDPQLEVNKEMRDIMFRIEQNTRTPKDDTRLDNAGLVGPQVA